MEEVTRCPLCSSIDRRPFDVRDHDGEEVRNWICRSCGLVFLSPRRTRDELRAFYELGYRTAQHGTEEPTAAMMEFEAARAENQLAILRRRCAAVRDFLEIGCGAGRLMRLVSRQLGARAAGIEPGARYREFLRGEGLDVYGSLEELREREPGRRFDLVSLSHVLEHLPDPVGYLDALRQGLLQPTGALYVEVPNVLAHTSFEPGHLYSFTAQTLRRLVEGAGFGVLYLELHSRPRHRDPRRLYVSMVVAPEAAPASPTYDAPSPAATYLHRLVGHNGLDHPLWFLRTLTGRAAAGLRGRLTGLSRAAVRPAPR
jgi:SAM-dependent methyltransferase